MVKGLAVGGWRLAVGGSGWFGLAVCSAGLTLSLSGCVDRQAQKQAKQTNILVSDPSRPVRVEPVREQTLVETLEITGTITTAEDSTVSAKTGGRLVAVMVRDGDPVKTGQVIAMQDASDLMTRIRQAMAQVSSARAALSQALSNAAITPSKSTAGVASAEAQVRQAKAQLSKLKRGARTEEKAQIQAAVNATRSNMEMSRRDLDRKTRLAEEGAISKQQLDQAQNAYNTAVALYENAIQNWTMTENGARPEDIVAAEQNVSIAEEAVRTAKASKRLDITLSDQVQTAKANLQAQQAGLALAQQALSDATIRSPFRGRISGKPAQVGTYVAPGTPVARIVGEGGLYFEGEVPEASISRIALGRPVRIQISALGNLTVPGSVLAINPLGGDIGRLFKVRVQMQGSLKEIRPGMFAKGAIEIRRIPNALTLPITSILRDGAIQFVYVVEGDKAHRRVVTPGFSKDNLVQVSGLSPGQNVVVQGQTQLAEGIQVKVDATPQPPTANRQSPTPEGR